MCLIILFHAGGLLAGSLPPTVSFIVLRIGNIGTPTFSYISGLMLGYFLYNSDRKEKVVRSYVKRGMLLLLVVHILNAVGVYPHYFYSYGTTFVEALIYRWFITDTIGLILLLTPLISMLAPTARLLMGVTMLALWKPLDMVLLSHSNMTLLGKEFLFGVHEGGEQILQFVSPLFPIMGIFLVGSYVGDWFAVSLKENSLRRFVQSLARLAMVMCSVCLLLLSLWLIFKFEWYGLRNDDFQDLLFPHRYYSLLPLYLAICFGVFALIVFRIEIRKLVGAVEEWVAVFGRTSLFTYVAQYYVFVGLPSLLGLMGGLGIFEWVLFVIVGFWVLYIMARFYDSIFGRKGDSTSQLPSSPEPVVSVPR